MAEQYIYAVARIRSRELSLLSEAVISQLSAAATEEDCRRILNEKNWGNPDLPSEEMFQEENKKTWALIRELVPNNMQIFDVFRLEKDYHNLKAAIKESCIDGIHPGIFAEGGTIPVKDIQQAVEESDYDALPETMRQVAQDAKETLLQTRDGQLCDVMIDRAALEEIRKAGEKTGEPLLRDLRSVRQRPVSPDSSWRKHWRRAPHWMWQRLRMQLQREPTLSSLIWTIRSTQMPLTS